MKMSDVVGAMGFDHWAAVAFAIAAAAFAAVVVTTLLRRNRAPFERARWLPLVDEQAPDRGDARSTEGREASHE